MMSRTAAQNNSHMCACMCKHEPRNSTFASHVEEQRHGAEGCTRATVAQRMPENGGLRDMLRNVKLELWVGFSGERRAR